MGATTQGGAGEGIGAKIISGLKQPRTWIIIGIVVAVLLIVIISIVAWNRSDKTDQKKESGSNFTYQRRKKRVGFNATPPGVPAPVLHHERAWGDHSGYTGVETPAYPEGVGADADETLRASLKGL